MKVFTFTVVILCCCFNQLFAEDGLTKTFKHVEMNINHDNYILFEDNSLVVCDRNTDEYLVEISEDFRLFVKGKEISTNQEQRDLLEDYYIAQYNLFSSRNIIGAKGVEIGIQSAKLAIKAVGGAFVLIASGFDDETSDDFEEAMEVESEKIEEAASELEEEADEYERYIYIVNKAEREMSYEIDELDRFDLYIDKDCLSISVGDDSDSVTVD